MLIRGQGGAKDETRAITIFTQLAETGDVLAMSNLAQAYRYGVGVAKNTETAQLWQKKHDQASRSGSPSQPVTTSPWKKGGPALLNGDTGQSPSLKKPATTSGTPTLEYFGS